MALKKVGSLYTKTDRSGDTYLVGKIREPIPEGAYLYIFKNKGDKKYETSADFYACLQTDDDKEGG